MSETPTMVGDKPAALGSGSLLYQMLQSEEYTDLDFSCRGRVYRVHKAVVCPQSPVIKVAVTAGFKETETETVKMDAFMPGSVRRFIQFLYMKSYDVTELEEDTEDVKDINQTEPEPDASENGAGSDDLRNDDSTNAEPPHIDSQGGDKQQIDPPKDNKEQQTDPPKDDLDGMQANNPVFKAILTHTHMNAMGDYYGVPTLTSYANDRINTLLSQGSSDQAWIAGLPKIAEAALEIANNEGLTDVLTTAITENLATILAFGALDSSPLMTPFGLAVIKRCSGLIQDLAVGVAKKSQTLNEVTRKMHSAMEESQSNGRAIIMLNKVDKCTNSSCKATFSCYIERETATLRCSACHAKHRAGKLA